MLLLQGAKNIDPQVIFTVKVLSSPQGLLNFGPLRGELKISSRVKQFRDNKIVLRFLNIFHYFLKKKQKHTNSENIEISEKFNFRSIVNKHTDL